MTETAHEPRLISIKAACELTSLSRTFINALRAKGKFPQAIELGEKRVAFLRSEVIDWIAARVEARNQGQRA